MSSLKEFRNRIATVQATQKITRAMRMVAASKLRRAQDAAEQARPYAEQIEAMLARMSAQSGASERLPPLLVGRGQDKVHLLLVATAERGLCGGFNAAIARQARRHARQLMADDKIVKLLCVGRKGYEALRRPFAEQMLEPILLGTGRLQFDAAERIAQRVLDLHEEEAFDVGTIFYARFQSVMVQEPLLQTLIPFQASEATETASDGARAIYEYEPDEERLLAELLPHNLAVQVWRALLENGASEQGARMTAMDSATRNAGEMIDRLTIAYNRTRQAMITKELIEIISGAEAL